MYGVTARDATIEAIRDTSLIASDRGSRAIPTCGAAVSASSADMPGQLAVKAGNVKTVLIADDEASLRLLVSATLEWEECTVLEAEDGDQAWEMIRAQRPTLAILDVTMPGRNGIELAQAIKSDPDLRDTKVVLLTAKAQPNDIQAGLDAGADLYLTKPFSPLELLSVVEQALEAS
jgi:CheY-like chemotaxis protein